MTTRRQLFEWSAFALIAVAFCVLLSFRPIPSMDSANDTGRYVTDLHQFCTGSFSSDIINKEISYKVFYAVTSPACLSGSDGVFLFEVAAFLPSGLIVRSNILAPWPIFVINNLAEGSSQIFVILSEIVINFLLPSAK